MQLMRLDFGKRANRNEHAFGIGCFIIFTVFSLIIYIYFGFMTTYTLVIDIGFAIFGMFFTGFEILAGIIAWIKFKKA